MALRLRPLAFPRRVDRPRPLGRGDSFLLMMTFVATGLGGCAPAPPTLQETPPQITSVVARHPGQVAEHQVGEGAEIAGDAELWIHGRGVLADGALNYLDVWPLTPTDRCVDATPCDEGPCDAGRCWEDLRSASHMSEIDDGEGTGGWPFDAELFVDEASDATVIRVRPTSGWPPGARVRWSLGEGAHDRHGLPLAVDPPGPLSGVARERWALDLWVAEEPGAPRLRWPPPHEVGEMGEHLREASSDLSRVQVTWSPRDLGDAEDGAHGEDGAWWLVSDADGRPHRVRLSPRGACEGGTGCAEFSLDARLQPGARYGLEAQRLHEWSSGPGGMAWVASRQGGDLPRPDRPSIVVRPEAFAPLDPEISLSWSAHDPCLRIEVAAEVPGYLSLVRSDGSVWGGRVHHGGASWWAVSPDAGLSGGTWVLETAWARAEGEIPPRPERGPSPGEMTRLTEVLFDPAGPEPQQEFVEFMTGRDEVYEPGRVHLHDGTWADILAAVEAGQPTPGDPLPRIEAAPGRVFVVVPEAHEWEGGQTPPADAVILKIPGSLGQQGLRNSGEPLTLYDAWAMTPLASFGAHGWPSVGPEGQAMVRLDLHASCDASGAWGVSEGPPTPGALP